MARSPDPDKAAPTTRPWPSLAAPPEGWTLAAILLLAAMTYLPTLGFGWVYDDAWTILSNGYLRTHGDAWVLFSPQGRARNVPDAFRPTLVAVDWLTYQRLGLDPRLHHGLSVALHLGACGLVYRLGRVWGAPPVLRLAATALFGLLALHAEPVAVISFREDLIAAVLGLGALWLADDASRPDRGAAVSAVTLACAAGVFALACGAKLSAAPLVVVMWLAHALDPFGNLRGGEVSRERPWPTPTRSIVAGVALLIGLALALVQRVAVLGQLSPYGAANSHVLTDRVGRGPVLAASVKIHLEYLGQMVVPTGLSPEYTEATASFGDPAVVLGLLGLAGALAYGAWGSVGRRRPLAAFVVLATAALMLPTSNLIGLSNLRADRFVYLSCLPVIWGLSFVVLTAGDRLAHWLADDDRPGAAAPRPDATIALAPLIVLLVVQGAAGMAASRSYASNTTLWRVASARAPGSARAQAMMGLMAVNRVEAASFGDPGLLAQAVGHCQSALRLDPSHELPRICSARVAVVDKRWTDAYHRYLEAIDRSPGSHDRLAAALIEVAVDVDGGPSVERIWTHARPALREYPYSPLVHAAVGRALHRTGHPHAARHYYDRARALYPERWQTAAREVELALDTGDAVPADALRRPHRHVFPGQFRAVDTVQRDALEARMATRRRRFLPPSVQATLDLLVQSVAPEAARQAPPGVDLP